MNTKKGNTLVEVLIYIALVSMIATVSVYFVTKLIQGRIKSTLQENVSHNQRLSARRLIYEIRQATAINSITPTSVCLASPISGRNNTRLYLTNGRLYLGWGGDCNNSTTTNPLTSGNVTISNLTLNNNGETINFSYKISGNISSGRQEWIYETTSSGSATLR